MIQSFCKCVTINRHEFVSESLLYARRYRCLYWSKYIRMFQLRFVFYSIKTNSTVKFSFCSHFALVLIRIETEMLKKTFAFFVVSLVVAEAVVVNYSKKSCSISSFCNQFTISNYNFSEIFCDWRTKKFVKK